MDSKQRRLYLEQKAADLRELGQAVEAARARQQDTRHRSGFEVFERAFVDAQGALDRARTAEEEEWEAACGDADRSFSIAYERLRGL